MQTCLSSIFLTSVSIPVHSIKRIEVITAVSPNSHSLAFDFSLSAGCNLRHTDNLQWSHRPLQKPTLCKPYFFVVDNTFQLHMLTGMLSTWVLESKQVQFSYSISPSRLPLPNLISIMIILHLSHGTSVTLHPMFPWLYPYPQDKHSHHPVIVPVHGFLYRGIAHSAGAVEVVLLRMISSWYNVLFQHNNDLYGPAILSVSPLSPALSSP